MEKKNLPEAKIGDCLAPTRDIRESPVRHAWGTNPPRTCRLCKKTFTTNYKEACRYHPESFSGETAQRWMSPGDYEGGGITHYFWSCCGASDEYAKGCCFSFHITYDEPEPIEMRRPGMGIDQQHARPDSP
jgi:hypothetical protein